MADCDKLLVSFLIHIMTVTFLSWLIPFVSGLSFSLDDEHQVVQVMKTMRNTSDSITHFDRAIYYRPVHLWDKASRNLADFTTHFSFVVNSVERETCAGGLAFFLAPEDSSELPLNVTEDGTLGLTRDGQELNTTENHFVAVELDLCTNDFDPPSKHIGIDINSLKSVNSVTWLFDLNRGEKRNFLDVWIDYNSTTFNLSVAVNSGKDSTTTFLNQIIDLRDHLPELVRVGLSSAVPNLSAKYILDSWSFNSALQMDDNATNDRQGLALRLGVAGGGATALIIAMGVAAGCVLKRRKRLMERNKLDDEFRKGTRPKKFSYRELARATNNFSDEQKLGEGGFGVVYKGFLQDMGMWVAVKRITTACGKGIEGYAAEVKIVSQLRHKNLVELIGWCHENKKLLIVYEFLENCSLDYHLFEDNNSLTWEKRYGIAQGLACVLHYLYEEWKLRVLHGDIKSSNVLLDSNFNPKLADFGLAQLVDHDSRSQLLQGWSPGYTAPECFRAGRLNEKADVYSYGVVALEIACGRKVSVQRDDGTFVHIVEWTWGFYGNGKLLEVADPKLRDEFDKKEMECLMIVGLWCAHPEYTQRPSIREAMTALISGAGLPNLPLKYPGSMGSTFPCRSVFSSTFLSKGSTKSSLLSILDVTFRSL